MEQMNILDVVPNVSLSEIIANKSVADEVRQGAAEFVEEPGEPAPADRHLVPETFGSRPVTVVAVAAVAEGRPVAAFAARPPAGAGALVWAVDPSRAKTERRQVYRLDSFFGRTGRFGRIGRHCGPRVGQDATLGKRGHKRFFLALMPGCSTFDLP